MRRWNQMQLFISSLLLRQKRKKTFKTFFSFFSFLFHSISEKEISDKVEFKKVEMNKAKRKQEPS